MTQESIKREIILSTIIFLGFTFIGGIVYFLYFYDDKLLTETMINENTSWIAVFINNLIGCLIMISGFLIFGISSFLYLIFNSLIFGMALVTSYAYGATIKEIVLAVLPHGIFEIPAIILAAAIGFLGFKFYDQNNYKKTLIYITKLSVIVIVMLFIASIVETNITIPLR